MANIDNLTNLFEQNENLNPFMDVLNQILELPDEQVNDTTSEIITGMINGAMTENVRNEAIQSVIDTYREMGYSKLDVVRDVTELKNNVAEVLQILETTEQKKNIIRGIFDTLTELFDAALERFLVYDIELPIQLEEGAIMPTYAHETDACADLFITKDTTIPAHTMSTKLNTGVHIALPQGWLAMIFPRSSIGFNTPLRLSNSAGIIDEEYRGELGVLYDNVSDSDITFKQGERIAQMLVMPSYKFKPKPMDDLPPTSRGEGGFGSTGK